MVKLVKHEKRIVLDGGLVAEAGEALAATAEALMAKASNVNGGSVLEIMDQVLDSVGDLTIGPLSEAAREGMATIGDAVNADIDQVIVFVDSGVADIDLIRAGMRPGAELHILDANKDGLTQIAEILAGRDGVGSVHIISHGGPGSLTLGDSTVSFDALTAAQQASLAKLGQSMTANGDILIYGCDFAAGDRGAQAVARMADLTGADVAASLDRTGSADLGGDWDLEVTQGLIETALVIDKPTQEQVNWVLGAVQDVTGANFGLENGNNVLMSWLDASETSTLNASTNGADVTSWAQKSVMGARTLTYIANGSNATVAATYSTANGGGVTFNGTNDLMSVQTATGTQFMDSGQFEIFMVAEVNVAGSEANGRFVAFSNGTSKFDYQDDGFVGMGIMGTSNIGVSHGGNGNVNITTPTTSTHILNTNGSATAIGVGIDGSLSTGTITNPTTNTITSLNTMNSNRYTLGGRATVGDGSAAFTVHEILIFERQLNVAERSVINNYLAEKWAATGISLASSGTDRYTGVNIGGVNTQGAAATDLAGIGKSGSGDAASATSGGLTVTTGSTAGLLQDNGDYFMLAHNNSGTTTSVVNGVTAIDRRWSGTLTQAAGSNNTGVNIQLSASALGMSTGLAASSYKLLYDSDGNGSLDATISAFSNSSGTILFKDVDASVLNGHAFTVGTSTNNAPSINISDTATSYTENAVSPTHIDAGATLSDSNGDADWNGGTLAINISSGSVATDRISINDNNGTGSAITVSGFVIRSDGVDIGSLSTDGGTVTGSTTLTITFNASATNANVQEVLRSIVYDNTGDDPGSGSRTITVTATDKNVASALDTRVINVTPVNDAPTATVTGLSPTYTEDGSAADLFSGVSVSAVETGQTIVGMTFTVTHVTNTTEYLNIDGTDIPLTHGATSTTAGNTLTYSVSVSNNTATVTLTGGTLSGAQAATVIDGVSYRNSSQNPATADSRLVTLTSITDSGNNGGNDVNILSGTLAQATVTVVAQNDSPTFTGNGTLSAVNEETASPSGATVSSLMGSLFSDVDGDSFAGIAITADASNPTTEGNWEYSADGGATWSDIGSVSTSAALLLNGTSDQTMLRFVPVANYAGTPGALTVFAVDNSSGTTFTTNGSRQTFNTDTDNSVTSKVANAGVSLGTSITAVNDSPVITAGSVPTVSVGEDSSNVTATSLGLSSLTYGPGGGSDESGQTLTYKVTAIPSFVTLWLTNGSTQVNANDTISASDLQGLKYKTVADANGTGNITWTVVDTGGGLDTRTENLSITVTATNDTPVITAGSVPTVSVSEDSSNVTATSLGLSFLTYGPGGGSDESGQTLTYKVTAIPSFVTLWLTNGSTQVNANDTISASDLQGLKYKTVANANGTGNITWTVVDTGGGLDTRTENMSITVTADNDPPTLSTNTGFSAVSGATPIAHTITNTELGATDVDNTAAQLTYTITTAPSHGTLKLNGSALAQGQTFTQDDIDNNRVTYLAATNDLGNFSFVVSVSDGTATLTNQTVNVTNASGETVPPTLSNFTSSTANNTYKAGDTINITATYNEALGNASTMQVTLNTGRTVTLNNVSGSTVSGTYTVQAGDNTADLSVSSIVSENVVDISNNAQTGSSVPGSNIANLKDIVVDTLAPTPTVTTATISPSGNAVVRSTEVGTAYLVDSTVSVTNIGHITGLAGSQFNSVAISTANVDTNLPATGLASGSYKVYVVDSVGNLSAAAANLVTVDATGPAVSGVAITSATGAQNSLLNAGDVVSVTVTMNDVTTVNTTGGTPQLGLNIGGTTVQAQYASGSGTNQLVFTYTILSSQTDANGISIDANSLAANGGTLQDSLGNNATLTHGSVSDNGSFKVDTTAPAQPGGAADLDAGSDTGTSSTDNRTKDNTPTLTGAGGGVDGETVTIYVDNVAVGTTTVSGNAWSFTPSTPIADGSHNVTFSLTDLAGNESTKSAPLAIVIDTAATQPVVTATATASSTPTITGTVTLDGAAGESLSVVVNGKTYTVAGGNLTVGGGTWSLTIPPGDALSEGTYTVTATVSDSAANSAVGTGQLVVDSTAPAAPVVNTLGAGTTTVSGTAEPGATVQVTLPGGGGTRTVTVAGNGTWTVTGVGPFTAGQTVTAKAIDAAGNESSNGSATAIVTNTAPTLGNNTGWSGSQGATGTLTSAQLSVLDSESGAASIVFTVTGKPGNGVLQRNGVTLGTGGTFTQDDINQGRVKYIHSGNGSTADNFRFTASDGQGGTLGEQTFSISVAARVVNTTPTTGAVVTQPSVSGGATVVTPVTVTPAANDQKSLFQSSIGTGVTSGVQVAGTQSGGSSPSPILGSGLSGGADNGLLNPGGQRGAGGEIGTVFGQGGFSRVAPAAGGTPAVQNLSLSGNVGNPVSDLNLFANETDVRVQLGNGTFGDLGSSFASAGGNGAANGVPNLEGSSNGAVLFVPAPNGGFGVLAGNFFQALGVSGNGGDDGGFDGQFQSNNPQSRPGATGDATGPDDSGTSPSPFTSPDDTLFFVLPPTVDGATGDSVRPLVPEGGSEFSPGKTTIPPGANGVSGIET
ncbi:MAG: DUF4347 domain-containing protein [Gammaproteobacteria bacterium]|nr:DUF4347 domain-containing protein [Gammaproteobacteria bacterium]MCP5136741.1 DUF4347 domain-containing protein [Gammaproteobacteria bacterium]